MIGLHNLVINLGKVIKLAEINVKKNMRQNNCIYTEVGLDCSQRK